MSMNSTARIWMAGSEGVDDPRPVLPDVDGEYMPIRSVPAMPVAACGLLEGTLEILVHGPDRAKKVLADGGEADPTAGSVEQAAADARFQGADDLADARGRER